MRAGRLFRARRDVIDLLLRQGRLADIQLLNFYNMEVERECARKASAASRPAAAAAVAKAATASPPASPAATEQAAKADAAPAASDLKAKVDAVEVEAAIATKGTLPSVDTVASLAALEVTRTARREAHARFRDHLSSVRQTAVDKGPLEWIGQAYGTDTWTSSCLSKHSVKAQRLDADSRKVKLHGTSLVCGGPGSTPTSARIVVNFTDKDSEGAVATLKLSQPGVKTSVMNGVMRLDLTDAEGVVEADALTSSQLAAAQHLTNASAYSGMLAKLEEICALHATHAVRYDGLLIRNPAVQMRLSQLACFRFAIESLSAYVLGDGELDDEDESHLLANARRAVRDARKATAGADGEADAAPSRAEVESANAIALDVALKYKSLNIPLLESTVLNIYAETALMDGLDGAWALVRDTSLSKPVPHRSRPAKLIDYPYIQSLFDAPKYALTSNDGPLEMQAQEFLTPLLRDAPRLGAAGASANPLQAVAEWVNNLVGLSAGGQVRLAAPHVNLKVAARHLETDVATLLRVVHEQHDIDDPVFIIAVGQYLSEVFANLAVLYRCTAALNYDEEGKGHREWLLTEAFCASSKVRRQNIVNDLKTTKAATNVLRKAADLDNYCIHPVELMNTAPRKSSGGKSGPGGNGNGDAKAEA